MTNTITLPRATVLQALEALEAVNRLDLGLNEYANRNLTTLDAFIQSAIDDIKKALAQPV